MKPNLSPWWGPNTKPLNHGVYETIYQSIPGTAGFKGWSRWMKNNQWSDTCTTIQKAMRCTTLGAQYKKWREIVK